MSVFPSQTFENYVYLWTHIHVCNNDSQRKRGNQFESEGYGRGSREGNWEGLGGGRRGGSSMIIFQFKNILKKKA